MPARNLYSIRLEHFQPAKNHDKYYEIFISRDQGPSGHWTVCAEYGRCGCSPTGVTTVAESVAFDAALRAAYRCAHKKENKGYTLERDTYAEEQEEAAREKMRPSVQQSQPSASGKRAPAGGVVVDQRGGTFAW